eukprot:scaffold742_cov263-Pinguiococcus_pyrenoidosus.AAC.10
MPPRLRHCHDEVLRQASLYERTRFGSLRIKDCTNGSANQGDDAARELGCVREPAGKEPRHTSEHNNERREIREELNELWAAARANRNHEDAAAHPEAYDAAEQRSFGTGSNRTARFTGVLASGRLRDRLHWTGGAPRRRLRGRPGSGFGRAEQRRRLCWCGKVLHLSVRGTGRRSVIREPVHRVEHHDRRCGQRRREIAPGLDHSFRNAGGALLDDQNTRALRQGCHEQDDPPDQGHLSLHGRHQGPLGPVSGTRFLPAFAHREVKACHIGRHVDADLRFQHLEGPGRQPYAAHDISGLRIVRFDLSLQPSGQKQRRLWETAFSVRILNDDKEVFLVRQAPNGGIERAGQQRCVTHAIHRLRGTAFLLDGNDRDAGQRSVILSPLLDRVRSELLGRLRRRRRRR